MIQIIGLMGALVSNLFWKTEAQMDRLVLFFPKSHVKRQADGRRAPSGIIFIDRNGLKWCDAPREYGLPKTFCSRWKRWGDMGTFARIMEWLAPEGGAERIVMIDAAYLKVHGSASSLRAKKGGPKTSAGAWSCARRVD